MTINKRAGAPDPRPGTLYLDYETRQWWVFRNDYGRRVWSPIGTDEAIVISMRQLAVRWHMDEVDEGKWACASELLDAVGRVDKWR